MTKKASEDIQLPNPGELAKNLATIAGQSQKLVTEFLARQQSASGQIDPLNIGSAFMEMTSKMMSDPAQLLSAQMALWNSYLTLWQDTTARFLGQEPKAQPPKSGTDKRFKDSAWDENHVFSFIKESYLLTARWLQDTVSKVEGLDQKTAKKVDFYTRQFVDAMAPSNFVLTNPEVLRTTIESNGKNLVNGLDNMLKDLERGKGQLAIKMTDMDAFKLGVNVAITPGQVVYQNDLIQLIQYSPTTAEVYKRPLLIVPPWINKFYILDLKEENSFIKWAVAKGYTIFVVSWVNPDEKLAEKGFEDYMKEGIFDAIDAIEKATGEDEVTMIGYCIGGTLTIATLAYMAAKNDERVKAVTFFAAQADFSEAGELQIFIDEEQLQFIENKMAERGFLDGAEMSTTFNMLRANDLIWSFVVNNYLLGKEPFPFDLLFWNADATRMPRKVHSYYLRNMYQKNLLSKPGGLTINKTPIDLGKIKIPVYLQCSKEDHIAPFRSVYKTTHLVKGPVRLMLAGSGHIAGVINPPAAKKYQHWVNDSKSFPPSPEAWFAEAKEVPGSWWDDWDRWLSKHSGAKVPARKPGDGKLKAIEPAPGSYVKVRS